MNYKPNTTQWKKGDIVIHDADEKDSRMLMRVVGYTRNGLCRTVYLSPKLQRQWGPVKRSRLVNPIRFLLDPALFPILTDMAEVVR